MTTIQRRRVVITGMGTINPCGNNVQDTWANLLAGRSGVGLITKFDTADFTCKIAGQVKDFVPDSCIDRKEQKKMDLFIQYAMSAAQEAMLDVVLGGPMSCELFKIKEPLLKERKYLAQFPLKHMAKDLKFVTDTACSLRCPAPSAFQNMQLYNQAMSKGMGELDFSALIQVLESMI